MPEDLRGTPRVASNLRKRATAALATAVAALVLVGSAVVPQPAAASDPVQVALAPIVHLPKNETSWPDDPNRFIRAATLNWRRTHATANGPVEIVDRRAASGSVSPSKLGGNGTTPYTALLDTSSDIWRSNDYTRPYGAGKQRFQYVRDGFFLDVDSAMHGGIPDQKSSIGGYQGAPLEYELSRRASVNGQARYDLTYFFFYSYNNQPTTIFDHEGDWERIVIYLDSGYHPLKIAYHFHECYVVRDWASAAKRGSHPLVWVATGGHGSYPNIDDDYKQDRCNNSPDGDSTPGGLDWDTRAALRNMRTEPWYHFGGAWGQTGSWTHSSGPDASPWKLRTDWTRSSYGNVHS